MPPLSAAPAGARGLRALAAVLLGLALLAACRTEPRATVLAPVVRFVEDGSVPRPVGTVDWGSYVTIAGEARPTLSASRRVALLARSDAVPAKAARVYALEVPADLRSAAALVLEGAVEANGRWDRQVVRLLRPAAGEIATEVSLRLPGAKAGQTTRVSVVGRTAVELPARDVVTGPVAIPVGAELRFAIGVEESAWTIGSPPLEFTLAALDGDETVLYHRRLDPAHVDADRRWVAERVDLARFARRTIRFRFGARALEGGEGAVSLPVWGDPSVFAPQRRTRPDVLVVSLDTLRAESASAYGYGRETTPNLQALMASRGTLFEQAIAPYPHTLPSHVSMFTGLYHRTHGVRGLDDVLAADRPTLPEALRAAGYETAAFTEDAFLVAEAGLRRGFGLYVENKSPDFHRPSGQIAETFAQGVAWLTAHADGPFFLFLHTYQVHWPYEPPAAYRLYFGDPAPIAATVAEASRNRDDPAAQERLLGAVSDSVGRLPYEQDVRYVDDELRRLLERLEALGLADTTLVVVLADHGEEFLEHGRRYHGRQLYDEVLRVPFVMRLPGIVPAGRRVPQPVSLVDLAPTVLELLGLPPLRGAEGLSLMPLLRDPPGTLERQVVLSEAASGAGLDATDVEAARGATRKCIYREPTATYQCFDLVADPGERRPLSLDVPDPALEPVRAALDAFRATPQLPAGARQPSDGHDLEREQKLRALGYVE